MYNECRHIKDDGQRCRSAALKGKPYCYFHMKLESIHKVDSDLPAIEDSTSILLAIGQVLGGLRRKDIEPRHAGLMLYALQIASGVAKQRQHAAEPAPPVRSVHNLSGEPVDFHQSHFLGGDMLAPENTLCEPPLDCTDCRQKGTCTRPDAAQPVIDHRLFRAFTTPTQFDEEENELITPACQADSSRQPDTSEADLSRRSF